ncbi:MAG: apolipoprotein N-acyltransferase, partial [Proteobacteria bacterium]|nr:apolipoprotein N-acyltransferase [Pseudomonadota bacterium]
MGILKGMATGWVFGTICWAAGTWWVINGMEFLLNLNAGQSWTAGTLFWLYQGLPFALLGGVHGWLSKQGHHAGPLFCASLLTLLIFLRPAVCPISSVVAVAQWTAFIQIADIGGEYFVLFVFILVNWLIADFFSNCRGGEPKRKWISMVAVFILLAAVLGYGHWRIFQIQDAAQRPGEPKISVASIQPNVPVRWDEASLNAFATDEALCLDTLTAHSDIVQGAGLLVFPELPKFDCKSGEFENSGLKAALLNLGIPVLMTSDEYIMDPDTEQVRMTKNSHRMIVSRRINAKFSSVFTMPPGKNCSVAYRKVKLVPFSEATPLINELPWLKKVLGQGLEFSKGDGPHLIGIAHLSVQPLICFESGFSRLVGQGVFLGADLLVEVSNDGWFSCRDAEIKHLSMGIFRAVEFRRPLVRCSNSGGGAHIE